MPIKIAIGCSSHLLGEALKKVLEDDPKIMVIGIFTEKGDLTSPNHLNACFTDKAHGTQRENEKVNFTFFAS